MPERLASAALSGWQRLIDLPDEGFASDDVPPRDEVLLRDDDLPRDEVLLRDDVLPRDVVLFRDEGLSSDKESLAVADMQDRPEWSFDVGDGFGSRTGDRLLGARYAAAFREHWIYVLLTVALAVVGASAYVQLAEERYEATAEVSVVPAPDMLRGPVPQGNVPGRDVVTAARLTKSPQVTSRVRADLRLALSPSSVGDLVRVTPRQESEALSITGIGGSPDAAATIANAFADALLAERTRALSNRPDPTLEVARAAVPPSSPAWPRPLITILVAVVIGVLVGGVVAMALELANPIVMRTEALAELDGPPILARMPRLTSRETRQLLVDPGRASPVVREEARGLWEVVSGLLPNWSSPRRWSTPNCLLVTSAGRRDGAASIAATLAGSIAQSGMSVALIDVDLERGPIARIIDGGIRPAPSIGQILTARDASALLDRIEPISPSRRLEVLVAKDDGHLAERLPPDRLPSLVEYLKSRFHVLVISAPPLPSTDAVALLGSADAVILVVAMGRTRRDQLTRLREVPAMRDVASLGYVALERRSLLARLPRTASHLKPSARRRWAQRAHRLS
jgi:succinoglycan biosynthesis transport protein ExoP